ncbi:MAG: TfoX/Sxy family protein [Parvularculaceae bacterium]|nr:TfoX/Sxy family protein [Parvularculaceae bacterium]
MALGRDFFDFAAERLSPLGEIRIRKMFGGAGVYCDGLFFALLDDDLLYLKTDDLNRAAFEAAGLAPFIFRPKDGPPVAMSYYGAPETVWDDEDDMRRWAGLALDAARRAASKKPAKPIDRAAARKTTKPKTAKGSGKRA